MEECKIENIKKEIIEIIEKIEDINKLKFWYKYIKAIERGQD